ncbi:MAG: CoA transferase [Deltaproteobacteria bacterium]|nr:CoA transferase [Deltaproteobacteria bacterium]
MAKQVFEGIKVADFAWVGVGPQVGRELAEHGATVVRVESHKVPDSLRTFPPFRNGEPGVDRSAFGAAFNTNKYGVAMDLTIPKGQELAKKLVAWADIVTESFTPGTMAKFGLDYESCKKIKPDIIYFSTCQMGQTGPLRRFGAYGMFGTTYAGFANLLGLPDREPLLIFNNYSDFIAPWYLTSTVIAALIRRRKTGEGVYLDQSQVEAGVTFLGPTILDYMTNGRVAKRMGNRDPYRSPHGIFPCLGQDRWVAITVEDENQWGNFCRVVGNPAWSKDQKFSTFLNRKKNEDELETLISEWTSKYPPEEIMKMMQEAKVPCGMVQTAEDLFNDPQLKHREHYRLLEHTVIGEHAYNAPAYRLSKTPNLIYKPGPCLGEDLEFVFKEILGLTDEDISDLFAEGVITTEADVPGAE